MSYRGYTFVVFLATDIERVHQYHIFQIKMFTYSIRHILRINNAFIHYIMFILMTYEP